jgi:hypothetical protein
MQRAPDVGVVRNKCYTLHWPFYQPFRRKSGVARRARSAHMTSIGAIISNPTHLQVE